MPKNRIETSGEEVFRVPNTPEIRAALRLLAPYLNHNIYDRLHYRGRGTRKDGRGTSRDLPIKNAETIAVYIREKPEVRWEKHRRNSARTNYYIEENQRLRGQNMILRANVEDLQDSLRGAQFLVAHPLISMQ